MKRKGDNNSLIEEEIKIIKKLKIKEKEKQFSIINIFLIGIDILKELLKFIFYNNKKDLTNLRLSCRTFRNLCSPYWKQSVHSLYLNDYLENINRMGFEIEELNIIENKKLNIININYSNIFSKLPKNLIKLTISKETISKDLQYLSNNIKYLNLSKMDFSKICFSDIPETIKFLSLEDKFIISSYKYDLKFIKDFKNPNIYLQKYVNNNNLFYIPLLFFPIINNDEQFILYLLKKGANINQKDTHNGQTALIYKCIYKNLEIVKLLIKNGANINEKDDNGNTPLIYSSRYSCLKLIKLLFENGANINEKNNNGETALMFAIYNGYLEIVQFLIENGANINEKDNNGDTVLMYAIIKNLYYDKTIFENIKIIEFLIKINVNINQKNNSGNNALMMSYLCNQPTISKILIKASVNINENKLY